MPMSQEREWDHHYVYPAKSFVCGYPNCGSYVSSEKGWKHKAPPGHEDGSILTCPKCKRPSFFDHSDGTQLPGVSFGNTVKHLPADVSMLYNEMRGATGRQAFTSAVLMGRKLLMHVAVEQDAPENQTFLTYVDYLVDNHFAPPKSKAWVDKIRTLGNDANHEIKIMSKDDAENILTFLEMLLKFIYEFPGPQPTSSNSTRTAAP